MKQGTALTIEPGMEYAPGSVIVHWKNVIVRKEVPELLKQYAAREQVLTESGFNTGLFWTAFIRHVAKHCVSRVFALFYLLANSVLSSSGREHLENAWLREARIAELPSWQSEALSEETGSIGDFGVCF